jgi:hypothetical protein
VKQYAVHLCGGDTAPAFHRDSDCPDSLHDWPLPSGYTDAAEEAARRLARRWANRRCRHCGLYGWTSSGNVRLTTAEHWQPQTIDQPERARIPAPDTSEEK